jgi:hypothetical protein
MAVKVKITNARLAFPNLFEPGKFGQWGGTLILDEKNTAAVQKAMKAIAEDEFKGVMPSPPNRCLRKNEDKSNYGGFEDENGYHLSANRREPFKPNQLIERDKTPAGESTFYPGCYVNAVVNVWAQNNSYGKKLNCELVGVQFYKDGERLGRGVSDVDDDDFETLPDLEEPGETKAQSADDFF